MTAAKTLNTDALTLYYLPQGERNAWLSQVGALSDFDAYVQKQANKQ